MNISGPNTIHIKIKSRLRTWDFFGTAKMINLFRNFTLGKLRISRKAAGGQVIKYNWSEGGSTPERVRFRRPRPGEDPPFRDGRPDRNVSPFVDS